MSSPTNNSSMREMLNANAFKDKKITYEELAKCTGTSRSRTARYLSRLEVLIKGGGIITDAKVNKLLANNAITNLNDVSNQFKDKAKFISNNATNESYTATELKSDSKDLKRAGDLIKLFEKHKDYKQAEALAEVLFPDISNSEKTQAKPEVKGLGKKSTEPQELKEINDAKFILSARAAMLEYPPADLLKAALWENHSKQPLDKKGQLSNDFLEFLMTKNPLPTDKTGLDKAYNSFISETLKETAGFQKNTDPYDKKNATAHKAKVEDYIKPKIPPFAQLNEINLLNSLNKTTGLPLANDFVQKLFDIDERTLLEVVSRLKQSKQDS